jgi:hypothetical protein
MAFTTYFYLSKPAQATQRYDLELNDNMDLIEAALLGFPSEYPPGDPENYPNVTPVTGMRWIDTGNDQEKVYYNGSWQVVHTFT